MSRNKKHALILSILVIGILIWGIILKRNQIETIRHNFNYMITLDLFSRFTYSLNPFINTATTKKEIVLNIIAFMPFGFLVSALFEKQRMLKTIFITLFITLIFESIQAFSAIGGFSTIDIICNSLGGIIGCIFCSLCMFILAKIKQQSVVEKTMKILIVLSYIILTLILSFAIINTILNIEFYISLYL